MIGLSDYINCGLFWRKQGPARRPGEGRGP